MNARDFQGIRLVVIGLLVVAAAAFVARACGRGAPSSPVDEHTEDYPPSVAVVPQQGDYISEAKQTVGGPMAGEISVIPRASVTDLVDHSDFIGTVRVTGKLEDFWPFPQLVFSRFTAVVMTSLKGPQQPGDTITLMLPGGRVTATSFDPLNEGPRPKPGEVGMVTFWEGNPLPTVGDTELVFAEEKLYSQYGPKFDGWGSYFDAPTEGRYLIDGQSAVVSVAHDYGRDAQGRDMFPARRDIEGQNMTSVQDLVRKLAAVPRPDVPAGVEPLRIFIDRPDGVVLAGGGGATD